MSYCQYSKSMLIVTCLAIALFINFVLFWIAYTRQSDKLTDFAYALSFIAVVVSAIILSNQRSTLLSILVVMVVVWALRLGVFLVIRIRKTGKDARFDGIREDFVKFLKFWLGQGAIAWFLLLPVLFLAQVNAQINTLSVVGVVLWLSGLILETVADFQKYQFSKNPANRNKWIDTGLWRYSLHPNYFGEILVWVGVYVATYSSLGNVQRAIGLLSPVTIFIILRFVTGVPPLEKSANKRWGDNPKYQSYRKRTNLLIPFWPKA